MNEEVRKELVKAVRRPAPNGWPDISEERELFDHYMFHRYLRNLCEHDLGIKMRDPISHRSECRCLDCDAEIDESDCNTLYRVSSNNYCRCLSNFRRRYLTLLLLDNSSQEAVEVLNKECGMKLCKKRENTRKNNR